MKRLTMHTLFAAAALTVAATGASAQMLKAEIPFTFYAGQSTMAPGTYLVTIDHGSGSAHFVLRNLDTRKAIMLVQGVGGVAPKAWRADGQPRIGFECAGARCALRQLWSGGGDQAYFLRGPNLGRDEAARVTEIVLTKAN